jgi:hypothetical protein
MKRLAKYYFRGFRLGRLSFDERISEEWKDHILLQFHLRYARLWMSEWADLVGMPLGGGTDLDSVIESHIIPFLENRSEIDLKKEMRAMLRRNILAEIERLHGTDPGMNDINMGNVLSAWRLVDETDGLDMHELFWKKIDTVLESGGQGWEGAGGNVENIVALLAGNNAQGDNVADDDMIDDEGDEE